MSTLRTAGELRGFLADVLIGIQAGTIDTNKANAIAKVSAQINQSLAVEVNTALQLERMGGERPVAGSMVIAFHGDENALTPAAEPAATAPEGASPVIAFAPPKRDGDKVWCDQCDMNVTVGQAVGCKSVHCKAKAVA